MWVWRKTLKISWPQKVTNQEVLDTIQEESNKVNNIHLQKHKWIGHVLRHDGLLHTIIKSRIEGKRGRGRKRHQMMDYIMEKEKYDNMKRTAENRTRWSNRLRKHQLDVSCQEPATT